MSKLGKKPIAIPKDAKVKFEAGKLILSGPKGSKELSLNDKIEVVATRVFEVQNYFIGYLEYKKENVKFGKWMNKRIKEAASELQKNEQSDGQNMERSTANQG